VPARDHRLHGAKAKAFEREVLFKSDMPTHKNKNKNGALCALLFALK
jgi:hypothetical protein